MGVHIVRLTWPLTGGTKTVKAVSISIQGEAAKAMCVNCGADYLERRALLFSGLSNPQGEPAISTANPASHRSGTNLNPRGKTMHRQRGPIATAVVGALRCLAYPISYTISSPLLIRDPARPVWAVSQSAAKPAGQTQSLPSHFGCR
jgi:hypothetical protein